ncbi:DgyrCDS10488 [Dimorphilus gyrociliatus]|uniref:DgyrCDS10488 n=1 Tax=Dimorphilus gyrociliatus TaxID=2664684 RepID=A0A7I8W1R2_9ANNE|nr:DgyrCDS10488 [Dimorphilus gyrociliatus]
MKERDRGEDLGTEGCVVGERVSGVGRETRSDKACTYVRKKYNIKRRLEKGTVVLYYFQQVTFSQNCKSFEMNSNLELSSIGSRQSRGGSLSSAHMERSRPGSEKILITEVEDTNEDDETLRRQRLGDLVGDSHDYLKSTTDDPESYDTDLEYDDNEFLNDKIQFDPTGIADYIQQCNKLGVIPVSYFVKHVHDKEFIMRNHGLGPNGAKAISKPLQLNTEVEKIDLEGNQIEGVGCFYLCKALRDNNYVTELILRENQIGREGAEAVCTMLSNNSIITSLDLSGNNLKDTEGELFHSLLMNNSVIRKLLLRHNELSVKSAKYFKEILSENETLRELDLSWNHFRTQGAVWIAQGVMENYGLKSLLLEMNGFGLEGAEAMGHALKHNQSLSYLELSNNRIPDDGAKAIIKSLQSNEILEFLSLGFNPITAEVCDLLLKSLQTNENSHLEKIELPGVLVSEEFSENYKILQQKREIFINHGGVVAQRISGDFEIDLEQAYHKDPMTKLQNFAKKKKFRLVDLFRQFDKDCSWSVSHEEFRLGIKASGIEMSEADICKLLDRLDADGDGEVDYGELLFGDSEHRKFKRDIEKTKQKELSNLSTNKDKSAEP